MPVSFLLLVHRRPRAGRDLDADVPLLPVQGVPDVHPRRWPVLLQHLIPRADHQQRGHNVEPTWTGDSLPAEILTISHSPHHRNRAGHRGEIRECETFYRVLNAKVGGHCWNLDCLVTREKNYVSATECFAAWGPDENLVTRNDISVIAIENIFWYKDSVVGN